MESKRRMKESWIEDGDRAVDQESEAVGQGKRRAHIGTEAALELHHHLLGEGELSREILIILGLLIGIIDVVLHHTLEKEVS